MRAVCDRANVISRRSKHYQHACQLLRVTQYLKTPFFLPCVVEEFDDDDVTLSPLQLPHVKRSQRRITYSSLSLGDKPLVSYTPCLDSEKPYFSLMVRPFEIVLLLYWMRTPTNHERHSRHVPVGVATIFAAGCIYRRS